MLRYDITYINQTEQINANILLSIYNELYIIL